MSPNAPNEDYGVTRYRHATSSLRHASAVSRALGRRRRIRIYALHWSSGDPCIPTKRNKTLTRFQSVHEKYRNMKTGFGEYEIPQNKNAEILKIQGMEYTNPEIETD